MKINKVYKLLHDAYVYDSYPGAFLVPKNGIKYSRFDEKLISFGRGSLKNLWPQDMTVNITGITPVDYLFCSVNIDAVSDHARTVIEKISPLDVEFFPLDVIDEDGMPIIKTKYWVINVLTIIDALDWDNTKWTTGKPPTKKDPTAFLSIIKPCLIESKINGRNIFRIEVANQTTSGKFISHFLRKSLEKEGCTIGMDFGQIKTI
ncbi:MAG: DUF1629 domain-containing protein [Anaerolineaceae bacterium]